MVNLKKFYSWLLASVVVLFGFNVFPVLAQEDFIITVGQDKVFTEFNYHKTWFENDPNNPEPWPVQRKAYSEGNIARVSLSATPGHAGAAQAWTGVQFKWDLREYTWEEVKNWPVKVTIDFSYQISAYWVQGNGSANAGVGVHPQYYTLPWYDFLGYETGEVGSRGKTTIETYQTTVEGLEGFGRRIVLQAYCQAHSVYEEDEEGNPVGTIHNSFANITINSIIIEFPVIQGIVYKDENRNGQCESEDDIPIPGATVKALLNGEEYTTVTDKNGHYYLSLPEEGKYQLSVHYELCGQEAIEIGSPKSVQVPTEKNVNISVIYKDINCSPSNLWELWHKGPIFDRDNVVLVHGVQLPGFGGKDKIGKPDYHFGNLPDLLQEKENDQYNVWSFEYADTATDRNRKKGYTYNHLEVYAQYLKETIHKINELNSEKESNKRVSSIIAHSMGGIVSRKCLQDHPYLRDIQLLTLATGHFGFEFTHIAPLTPLYNKESVRDMLPDGSYLWNLNFEYQQGSYKIASLVGTKDLAVKESSASLIESPDDPSEPIKYLSASYHFATIPGADHGINYIKNEKAPAFSYIKDFLSSNFSNFKTIPPQHWVPRTEGWRPYIIFCVASSSTRPEVALVKNGEEIERYKKSHLTTKGERCQAFDSNGGLSQGWIWMFNTPSPSTSSTSTLDYDSIRIYSGKEYVPVKITPGQSIIVKKLVGKPTSEETPKVAFSTTPISAEYGGWALAGSDGLYTKHNIFIPADSLSEDTVISVSEPEDSVDLSSAVEFGPSGLTFNTPATITVEYKDSDVPPGHNENEMRLLVWEDNKWKEVPGSIVNPEDNTVSGEVTHLSIFAAGILTEKEVDLSTQIAITKMIYGEKDILDEITQKVGDGQPPLLLSELKDTPIDLEDPPSDGKINPGEAKKLTMKFKFLETAGNEYQGKSINVKFKFLATQEEK